MIGTSQSDDQIE